MIKTITSDGKIHYTYALGEGPPKKKKEFEYQEIAEIEKIYYSPSEVGEILKESQSCIRFWNDRILENNERRHGKRIYTKAIIAKLFTIQNLIRVQRYTVQGAKQKLQQMHI